MITINEQFIEAEIYKQTETKSGTMYLAKVSFIDAGLYVTGITIRKSAKDDSWWIQLPAYRAGAKWISPFEVDQSKPFWLALHQKVMDAMNQYVSGEDTVVTDFDENEPINLDDIPFK